MTRPRRPVTFDESGDPRMPYVATVDGARWQVRINDLTEEPSLYTLLVDGQPAEDLQAWPTEWTRPLAAAAPRASSSSPSEDPQERAEYERERAQLACTLHIAPSKLVE